MTLSERYNFVFENQ